MKTRLYISAAVLLLATAIVVTFTSCSHSTPSPQPPVVIPQPPMPPVPQPSPSPVPVNPHGWLAANQADLEAAGIKGNYCINETLSDGSKKTTYGFGPCLIAFQHADGSFWTSK